MEPVEGEHSRRVGGDPEREPAAAAAELEDALVAEATQPAERRKILLQVEPARVMVTTRWLGPGDEEQKTRPGTARHVQAERSFSRQPFDHSEQWRNREPLPGG